MIRFISVYLLLLVGVSAQAQLNMTLKSNLKFDKNLSDIWGYVDETGKEYALVGLRDATAIVDISDPENPNLISEIPGPASVWRDIKTFGNHAYVITDRDGDGLHVLDLSNLPNPLDSTDHYFWAPTFLQFDSTQLSVCHNLYIEENTGVAYLAGCNINRGGVIAVDVTNPDSLHTLGFMDARYSHDVFVRNDTVYSSDINAGFFSIMDATDKTNPSLLMTQQTPRNFTHNTWLSDDSKVLFTTDERGNAPVAAYDISDFSDIRLLDEFRPSASLGKGLIPHNVHVLNDFLITSFYKEGVIITDASKPDNLVEVGNYDTYPIAGDFSGFSGSWGAYPFLPSGLILASDIGNGLFVLEPTYKRAAYLEGMIVDAQSGIPIPNVSVEILSDVPNLDNSQASGSYKTGQVDAGTFTVDYSKPGYESKQVEVQLVSGEVVIMDIALTKKRLTINQETISCGDSIRIQFSPNIQDFPGYRWTFLDGVPFNDISTNPEVLYVSTGMYTVRLEGLDENGNVVSTLEQEVQVKDVPSADFEITANDKEISFINLSNDATNYVWDFGDGTQSEEEAPSHLYDSTGVFQVQLTASNGCGEVVTSKTIAVTSTSLEDLGILETFFVAPNPFSEGTTLHYKLIRLNEGGRLVIHNVLGEVVLDQPLVTKENQLTVGTSLAKGVYFARLELNNISSQIIKLVKQ